MADPLDPRDAMFYRMGLPSDPMDPFEDDLDPLHDPFSANLEPFDSLPCPESLFPDNEVFGPDLAFDGPADPLDVFSAPGHGLNPVDIGNDPLKRVEPSALDQPTGPLESMVDDDPRSLLDQCKASVGEDPFPITEKDYEILDKIEAAIEGQEIKPTKPFEPEIPVPENGRRILGVSAPDAKVERKPERTYYREAKPKLWRPRPSKGLGTSSGSQSMGEKKDGIDDGESELKFCEEAEESVHLAECETCEHFQDDECVWQPEEEDDEDSG